MPRKTVPKKKTPNRWLIILLILTVISLTINSILIWRNWRRNIIVQVPDGDSVELSDGRRVRLQGVDAPEAKACLGDEAKAYLTEIALGKHVRLKEIMQDGYGRTLAQVIVEDLPSWISYLKWRYLDKRAGEMPPVHLNRAVLVRGLARYSGTSGDYKDYLKSAAIQAREAGIGIYSNQCKAKEPKSGECVIKGNVRAGDKVYYVPECAFYDQVVVNEAYGDVWFCTTEEARGAGFRLADSCAYL
jgi:endonuclease YncB( thermonuclease family)